MTKRALVIDDDDIARELLVSILEDGGYETYELPSPIGATNVIIRERIDVVVLDVLMPQLSGDKLAKLLRANARLSQLAIVLVSGCQPRELNRVAEQVDADAVVTKADVRACLMQAVAHARDRASHGRPVPAKV